MSPAWVSLCLSETIGEGAAIFTELGFDRSVMRFGANDRLFSNAISGGLGWAFPAALGYQLADREQLVVVGMGDGSYIFANPTACHQVAVTEALPVLAVVFNNGMWYAVERATRAMYPDGAAVKSNAIPFSRLAPDADYAAIARAHGWWGERVEDGAALRGAIERAVSTVRSDRKPALLEVVVST